MGREGRRRHWLQSSQQSPQIPRDGERWIVADDSTGRCIRGGTLHLPVRAIALTIALAVAVVIAVAISLAVHFVLCHTLSSWIHTLSLEMHPWRHPSPPGNNNITNNSTILYSILMHLWLGYHLWSCTCIYYPLSFALTAFYPFLSFSPHRVFSLYPHPLSSTLTLYPPPSPSTLLSLPSHTLCPLPSPSTAAPLRCEQWWIWFDRADARCSPLSCSSRYYTFVTHRLTWSYTHL